MSSAATAVTVHGALVVLVVLVAVVALDAAVALVVYRDALRRPDRAAALDAALAFAFPIGGWVIYLRGRGSDSSSVPRPAGSPAADPARPPSSADLLPRLTEELRLARAAAAHWQAVAAELRAELERAAGRP